MRLTETAFAKVNLALHVRARRDDGYHLLETLFVFADDGDVLTASPADRLSLSITGPFGAGLSDGDDNLVMRAAHGIRQAFGVTEGAAITLDKRLPVAAGIGGGSADAAALIRLLARLWSLDLADNRMMTLAIGLGADVPACLASQTVRGEGVGEVLAAVDEAGLSGCPILLVNPGVPCPTGPVFKAWDGVDRGPLGADMSIAALAGARNDLQGPAMGLVPEIAALLHSLSAQPGARLVRMSGSGATCFAVFDSEDTRDAASLAFSRYWTLATRLR